MDCLVENANLWSRGKKVRKENIDNRIETMGLPKVQSWRYAPQALGFERFLRESKCNRLDKIY